MDDDTTTADVDESHTPNYEEEEFLLDNHRSHLWCTDTRLRRTKLDVTVHVIDAEDAGEVSLTAREPQVGRTVVATVSDPDGGVTLTRWTWATSDALTARIRPVLTTQPTGQTCS